MPVQPEANLVELEVRIAARPDVVYAYFIDPEKMIQWKGIEATLEPRPGGIYRVNVTGQQTASGRYVELLPFERIVFTWGEEGDESPVPPGSTTVEVTLRPDGNETVLRLRHLDLPEDQRSSHTEGWGYFLPRLAAVAEGRDPNSGPTAGGSDQSPATHSH